MYETVLVIHGLLALLLGEVVEVAIFPFAMCLVHGLIGLILLAVNDLGLYVWDGESYHWSITVLVDVIVSFLLIKSLSKDGKKRSQTWFTLTISSDTAVKKASRTLFLIVFFNNDRKGIVSIPTFEGEHPVKVGVTIGQIQCEWSKDQPEKLVVYGADGQKTSSLVVDKTALRVFSGNKEGAYSFAVFSDRKRAQMWRPMQSQWMKTTVGDEISFHMLPAPSGPVPTGTT